MILMQHNYQPDFRMLEVGKLAKVIALCEDPDREDQPTESIWSQILEIKGDLYHGVVVSHPERICCLEFGDAITFEKKNVFVVGQFEDE